VGTVVSLRRRQCLYIDFTNVRTLCFAACWQGNATLQLTANGDGDLAKRCRSAPPCVLADTITPTSPRRCPGPHHLFTCRTGRGHSATGRCCCRSPQRHSAYGTRATGSRPTAALCLRPAMLLPWCLSCCLPRKRKVRREHAGRRAPWIKQCLWINVDQAVRPSCDAQPGRLRAVAGARLPWDPHAFAWQW
jgi:hypothetical protein